MSEPSRVFYKGKEIDFIVFVDSIEALDEYKKEIKSGNKPALVDTISQFKIYKNSQGTGSTGEFETASKLELSVEFGDNKSIEDDIIPFILQNGEILASGNINKGRFQSTNDTKGTFSH
ncbi:hypothetical protein B5S28_g1331 [[Candida] boidinii]|uniref:Unnamed protein product n=1 Tax=Candida boidinii TaxID=5477 RepID=A0ACB5TYC2_CANBO|nr:hypothetical protein B5S28_g1331 [[Candida] boidinii]OWB61456.1 hypothetical protein B5S29_g2346 [[Candida] boidinii]OWB70802.1 hypothetical protein B5S31_g482 [[Candida] boidinii]OWB76292.1 hypothetical protein B5S32_g442 [[Candida] boidinii]GME97817.1 unnamed protein product [[Candida] boidinii]